MKTWKREPQTLGLQSPCLQRAPSPAHRAEQGTVLEACPIVQLLHPCVTLIPTPSPELQPIRPFASTDGERHSFLLSLLSALICGRWVEREPQARMTRLHMVYDVYIYASQQTIRTRSKLL